MTFDGHRARRTSGYVGIIGVVVFVCGVIMLHMVQPGLDPRNEAVSYSLEESAAMPERLRPCREKA